MINNTKPKTPYPNKWFVDWFGGGELAIELRADVPLWRRILTRILLGSVWVRLGKK